MKCLLCEVNLANVDELIHIIFIQFHHINETNYYFKELVEPDGNSYYEKKCYRCNQPFHRCRGLKNHNFLSHYQFGGQLPVENKPTNILKRSNFLTTSSINFDQHQNFDDFFYSEKLVNDFLNVFKLTF